MTQGDQNSPTAGQIANAISGNLLELVFEPKLNLISGDIVGCEALLRWPDASLGFISPEVFVPVAEHGGVIDQLTMWVMRNAANQWKRWQESGLSLDVAINISAWNLDSPDFPDRVHDVCLEFGAPPSCFTMELTESQAQQPILLMDGISRLRLKGFNIALDDFGTGFATLALLQQLPFNELKIDKCFVSEAVASKDARNIIRLIISLARQFKLKVTAEGIEDQPTLNLIRKLGCNEAQGYYIGRAMSGDQVRAWYGDSANLASQSAQVGR